MYLSRSFSRVAVEILAKKKGKKKKVIPWSVCTKTVGKEGDVQAQLDYEHCVQKVKDNHPASEGEVKTGE
jgi:hypothetical protein